MLDKMTKFENARAAFVEKARNSTATDGFMDGGRAMESELVSRFQLLLVS
jgi:hypothetical protein